jgi:putative transcriptional regulator
VTRDVDEYSPMKFENPPSGCVAGSVLAAVPDLKDPNFHQTLIYIAEHNDQGAFGLVMNRPLGKALSEVASIPKLPEALAGVRVFFGGPVHPQNLLLAMFVRGGADDELACRLDVSLDEAKEIVDSGSGWVRAFSGYSGWGEGQLDGELAQNAWKIIAADPILFEEKYAQGLWSVFVSDDERWRPLLKHLPDDPALN